MSAAPALIRDALPTRAVTRVEAGAFLRRRFVPPRRAVDLNPGTSLRTALALPDSRRARNVRLAALAVALDDAYLDAPTVDLLAPLFARPEAHTFHELTSLLAATASVPDTAALGTAGTLDYLRSALGPAAVRLAPTAPLTPLLVRHRSFFDGPVLALAPLVLTPVRMHTPAPVRFLGQILLGTLILGALCTALAPLVVYALTGNERIMLAVFLAALFTSVAAVGLLTLFLLATRPLVQPRFADCHTLLDLATVLTHPAAARTATPD